jgi:hypothetical protein
MFVRFVRSLVRRYEVVDAFLLGFRAGSYIVEFGMPAYLGLYPSFLVAFPYLGLRA